MRAEERQIIGTEVTVKTINHAIVFHRSFALDITFALNPVNSDYRLVYNWQMNAYVANVHYCSLESWQPEPHFLRRGINTLNLRKG